MRATDLAAALLSVAISALIAVGCSDAEGPPVTPTPTPLTHYVGLVAGSDAFIALVSDGRRAQAYVSDGKTIAVWFTGNVGVDGAHYLTGDNSGVTAFSSDFRLLVQLGPTEVTGQFLPLGGAPSAFTATPVTDGPAGLYRSEEMINNEPWIGGWILLPDGQLRGALVRNRSVEAQTALRPAAVRLTSFLEPVLYRN